MEKESNKKIKELNNKIRDEKRKKESKEKAEIERVHNLLYKELYSLKDGKVKIICKNFEENLSQTFSMRDFNKLIQKKSR